MITSFIPVGGVQNQLLGDMMFLKAIGCDCQSPIANRQSPIDGVGQWEEGITEGVETSVEQGVAEGIESGVGSAGGGFFSSIGSFFGSEFGSGLLKAGLTLGGAFALSELTGGGGSHGGAPGGVAPGGGGGGGAGQPIIIQQPAQSGGTELPEWVMPAAVVGGLGLVAALLLRKG